VGRKDNYNIGVDLFMYSYICSISKRNRRVNMFCEWMKEIDLTLTEEDIREYKEGKKTKKNKKKLFKD
jgi:hypothetical protein